MRHQRDIAPVRVARTENGGCTDRGYRNCCDESIQGYVHDLLFRDGCALEQ
jgi:hypothetical protein